MAAAALMLSPLYILASAPNSIPVNAADIADGVVHKVAELIVVEGKYIKLVLELREITRGTDLQFGAFIT